MCYNGCSLRGCDRPSKDGDRAPNLTRRDLFTEGFRIFGSAASTDYQAEAALQHGHYGPLVHKAWFTHLQIGEQWKAASKPKVTVLYDYASGDHDPFDEKHNNFETLYGSRRGELGPSGIWGWQSRSNLNSPSVQIQVNPAKDWDLIVHHQWLYLAQARDVWRGAGLGDPSGRSGRSVGQQTETRLHYRWNKWFDFETGYTVLREGSFLRALRPASKGWGGYFYSSSDWHF